MKPYTVVRCEKCRRDITHEIQIYTWSDNTKKKRITLCENDNWRMKEVAEK